MVRRSADHKILQLAGREVPLAVCRNPRARRITLRLDGVSGGVCLVLPKRTPLCQGLDLAERKARWILDQLDALPARVPFQAGAIVPVLGEDHVIRHLPAARRGVWREGGVIWASGYPEHLARRIADFLKAEARAEISSRARAKAAAVGRPVRRITLREMTTRWGSCGGDGNLSFSWRLILAPEVVLDYVVAHEVAHLRYMSHGPRFWGLAGKLTGDLEGARRWLKTHGDRLLSYG